MADKFEQQLAALDGMAKAIAQLRAENWRIILDYQKVAEEEAAIRKRWEAEFGGEVASEATLEKKISEFQHTMELVNETRSPRHRKSTKRLTGSMKLRVLIAMLRDFEEEGIEKVALEDIEKWTSLQQRGKKQEILNEMGIGRIQVPTTQFFQTKINRNTVRLYPDAAYETRSAPFKSYFIVKTWLQWLLDNEARLERGQKGVEPKGPKGKSLKK